MTASLPASPTDASDIAPLANWLRAARQMACVTLAAIACGAALAGEPAVSVEKDGEAFVVDARLEVPVALRTAWEVLTDYDAMSQILSNLASSRITQRSGPTLFVSQEGSAKYGPFTYPFASEREIRLEPMQRITARQLKGTARRFESVTELADAGSSTRIHYHAQIVPGSGIARTFGGPFIEHEVAEQLSALAAEMVRRNGL